MIDVEFDFASDSFVQLFRATFADFALHEGSLRGNFCTCNCNEKI